MALHAVMTPQSITIREDQSLEDALDSMYSNTFPHLPVVSEAGALVRVMSCREVPVIYQALSGPWIKAR